VGGPYETGGRQVDRRRHAEHRGVYVIAYSLTNRVTAESLANRDQRHNVEGAFGHYDVAVAGGHHVAHDAAAGWDRPGLELLRLGIETDQRIRLNGRFVVQMAPLRNKIP